MFRNDDINANISWKYEQTIFYCLPANPLLGININLHEDYAGWNFGFRKI